MKKATLKAIYDALKTQDFDADMLGEIEKELNKGAEAKAAVAKEYADAHDTIIGVLSDTPVTLGELYEAIKGDLPEGFGKGKVQYALTNLWQDEIVKIDGNPKSYRRNWGK